MESRKVRTQSDNGDQTSINWPWAASNHGKTGQPESKGGSSADRQTHRTHGQSHQQVSSQGDSYHALGTCRRPPSRTQQQFPTHPTANVSKVTSTTTSSQVTPKAVAYLRLSHLRQFSLSRAQVKVLHLLYPKHKVPPCAGGMH